MARSISAEAGQALRRERDAVLVAVREEDGQHEIGDVALGLELGDDAEALVRRVGEVEQERLAGLVHVVERAALVGALLAPVVPELAAPAALALDPEAGDRGEFRMQRLERERAAVDRHAGLVQPLADAFEEEAGVAPVLGVAEKPAPQLDRGGESRRIDGEEAVLLIEIGRDERRLGESLGPRRWRGREGGGNRPSRQGGARGRPTQPEPPAAPAWPFDDRPGRDYSAAMTTIEGFFPTRIYRAELAERGWGADRGSRRGLPLDRHGRPRRAALVEEARLPRLHLLRLARRPALAGAGLRGLVRLLDRHVGAFAKALEFDLGRRKLNCDSIWINLLPPGGAHSSHLHPHSAVSGTFYVALPAGASAIRFEDPRLGLMMAAPARKPKARPENRQFVSIAPRPGTILLWESFLRHEVPLNEAEGERISVSFNYRLA